MGSRSIIYSSYILDVICEEASGDNFFAEPGSRGQICNSYKFSYTVNPVVDELLAQASVFADTMLSQLGYQTRASRNSYNSQDVQNVKDAYVYSYCKTIFYSNLFARSKLTYFSQDDIVFGGHKVIFDLARINELNHYSFVHDVVVNTRLVVKDDAVKALSEAKEIKELWSKCVSTVDKESFYNQTYEYTLKYLRESYDSLDLKGLHEPSYYDETTYPLGNCCWNAEATEIKYLPGRKVASDFRSMCWGKACFVTVDEEAEIDSDDQFYRTTSKFNNKKKRMVMLDVSSIIGFCPLSGQDDFLTGMTGGNNPKGWSPKGGGGPGSSPNGGGNNPTGSDPNDATGKGPLPDKPIWGVNNDIPPLDPRGPGGGGISGGPEPGFRTDGEVTSKVNSKRGMRPKFDKEILELRIKNLYGGISRFINSATDPRSLQTMSECVELMERTGNLLDKRRSATVSFVDPNSNEKIDEFSVSFQTPLGGITHTKIEKRLEYENNFEGKSP